MDNIDKVAVFFDAENVSSKNVPSIINWISARGEIVFQRAYADWSMENTKKWQEQITKTPMTAIQQFHNNDKQVIDKAIMMDAMELALKHDEIHKIAIVASDNGYFSLALRLRELGKFVIGIGEKSKCNPLWIKSCNEFTYFEDIKELDEDVLLEDTEETREFRDFALSKFIEQAYDSTPRGEGQERVLMSRLGESIRRLKSDFNPRDYGFIGLLDFMKSMPEYEITNDGKNPPSYFAERKTLKKSRERLKGVISRWIKNYGIIQTEDKKDYFFYSKDILPESADKKPREKNNVEFVIEKEFNPEGNNTRERNGKAIEIIILS